MSGGHFGYSVWEIKNVGEAIEALIEENDDTTPNRWGEPKGCGYPPEIIAKFREAALALKVAHTYAQRVDYLLTGDHGEDSFLSRLSEDLDAINKGVRNE